MVEGCKLRELGELTEAALFELIEKSRDLPALDPASPHPRLRHGKDAPIFVDEKARRLRRSRLIVLGVVHGQNWAGGTAAGEHE